MGGRCESFISLTENKMGEVRTLDHSIVRNFPQDTLKQTEDSLPPRVPLLNLQPVGYNLHRRIKRYIVEINKILMKSKDNNLDILLT
jgi:hypothetical protein